jgi:hypothetical protein
MWLWEIRATGLAGEGQATAAISPRCLQSALYSQTRLCADEDLMYEWMK